nr:unnamed protein product [Callosobruchus analis]
MWAYLSCFSSFGEKLDEGSTSGDEFVNIIGSLAGIVFILNRYCREKEEIQDVEWGYTFDIHLNAFFPPLVLLHFFQLFFYNGMFIGCH